MMIYYAFNENKPYEVRREYNEFIYYERIIHYCSNCNTVICGEWDKNDNAEIDKKHFAELENCPICHNKFDEDINYHLNFDLIDLNTARDLRDIYLVEEIKYKNLPYESGFPCDKIEDIQVGEKISTDFGPVTVLWLNNDFSCIRIKRDYFDGTVESICSMLNYYNSKKYYQTAEKKIKTFIDKCILDGENIIISSLETNNNFNIKEYLGQLVLIEKNIFSLSERLRELYFLDIAAEKDALTSEKLIILNNANSVKNALNIYETIKNKNVANEIKITDFPIKYPKEPNKPRKPEEPILTQPGFFNKKRVLAENAVLIEKYEKELEAYNLAFEKYESDFKKYNETKSLSEKQRDESYKSALEDAKNNLAKEIAKAQAKYDELLSKQQETENNAKDIPTPEKAKHQFLKEEIEIAEELLKKFYKARNKMYSYGVIFEKYRDFVAVSSFYEYISSGRCETLEGPNGAYNLYENEIRMNTVIEKLNNVIESLEEIKQNQFMIYSAIQESNRHLKTLNSTTTQMLGALGELSEKATTMESYMSKIAYNTKVTAYNTEKTAFYAKKNAELTNALGFMVALK